MQRPIPDAPLLAEMLQALSRGSQQVQDHAKVH